MTVIAAAEWDENDLKIFLRDIPGPFSAGLDDERLPILSEPDWHQMIYHFSLAVHNRDLRQAEIIRVHSRQFPWAKLETRLLYIVEDEDISRSVILEDNRWMVELPSFPALERRSLKNALIIAMEFGKEDVVEYLLEDWLRGQIIPSTHIINAEYDSQKYFDGIFDSLPSNFASMDPAEQNLRYFIRRYFGTGDQFINSQNANILMNDEDLLMNLVRLQDQVNSFSIIWELYGHDQKLFSAMMNDAESISFHYFVPFNNFFLIAPSMRQLLDRWRRSRHSRIKLAADFLLTIEADFDPFLAHWGGVHRYSSTEQSDAFVLNDFPFQKELETLAKYLYEEALKGEARKAINFMSKLVYNRIPLDRQAGNSAADRVNQDQFGSPIYLRLLGLARLIDRCALLIENRMGLFFEVQKVLTGSNISTSPWHWLQYELAYDGDLGPFRRLFHCLTLRGRPDPFGQESGSIFRWSKEEHKLKLLWCFDEVQADLKSVSPSDPDASLITEIIVARSVLSCLVASMYSLRGRHSSTLAGTAMNVETIHHAVKEGTQYFESYGLRVDFPVRPFERCSLVDNISDFETILWPSIRSIFEVIWEATSPQLQGWNPQSIRRKLGPSLVGNESLFEDSTFLAKLHQCRRQGFCEGLDEMQSVNVTVNYFKSDELWPTIVQSSVTFWGRYRWSVYFLEELFRVYIMNEILTVDSILIAANEVQGKIKAPLRKRVEDLATSQDPERRRLACEIFHMAVQADLFSRPRILSTPNAATLIEEALGYVEEFEDGRMNVRLAERLVVEAIIDYLITVKPPGSLTDDYIGQLQYRPTSFGFSAEERLAEAIHDNARLMTEVNQRERFLENFDNVYCLRPITSDWPPSDWPRSIGLADFVLKHKPGPVSKVLEGHEDIVHWLHQVADDTSRPTFLLPKESAGPDLMFVLRKTSGKQVDRLICVVQSKVAKRVNVDDKVQHTVDPDQFFRGSTSLHEREQYLEALHTLKEDKFKRLLEKGERIVFFGILLLAADKNVQETQIVRELAAKKADTGFANDLVDSKIKGRREMQRKKVSVMKLNAARKDIQDACQIKSKVRSTEYLFKLLAHGSVESIFGPVFTRLVRAMKNIDPA